MTSSKFNSDEVRRLLGRSVRSLTAISVIPKGTTGRIVAAEERQPGQFDIVVEWDKAGFGMPDRDYFDRRQFERSLIEA
jgi:hypothetical protein